ncbi:hypothetical protein EBR21_09550, partial [bacterium]|nr:hypothetical protein [bacterium]
MPSGRQWQRFASIFAAPRLMAVVWLLLSVVVLPLSSCSKTSSEKTVKFEVALGNNQILAPREAAKQQLEFVISDSTGAPVPGIRVELRLLEVPEGDASLTPDLVKKLWDVSNASQSTINPGTLADKIGRIDGAKIVTTDAFGRVVVNVIAPSRFSAKIIVAARTLADQVVPDLIAFASLTTTSASSLGKISLESTYENNIVPAGKNADFWLVLRDQTGAIVTSYEGAGVFRVEATRPGVSWTGLGSPGFFSEVNCNFIAGRCVLPGSPFNFAKAEKLTVAVAGLAPAIERFETVVSVVKGEAPSQVIAADKLGGSDTRASPVRDVSLDTGQGVNLAAAWVDDGGNFLGDAADTRWFSSLQDFQILLPTDARSSFFFKPTKTGVFKIELNSPSAKQPSQVPVEVRSGLLQAWRIETQHSGAEAAGNCFRISITAIDQDGNAVPNVEGQIIGSLELGGVTDSPPNVNDVAHFERLGLRLAKEVASKVEFSMGTGTPSEQACLYDATNVTPKIIFSANGVTSEIPVTVLKGAASAIRLSRQNMGEASANACYPSTSPDNIGNPCIKFLADDIKINASSNTPIPTSMFASLTDQAGNWISDVSASWQITGPLGETNSNGTGKYALLGTFEPEQRLVTTVAGKGTFVISPQGGAISPQRFAYEVLHGAVTRVIVDTPEGGRQSTITPFQVKASIFDQWGNPVTSPTDINTNVSVSPAPMAPDGTTPASSSFAWAISFNNGTGIARSTNTLQLPCACNPENVPPAGIGCGNMGGYVTECPKIKLSVTSPSLGDFFSTPLAISPGPLKAIKMRSAGSGLGNIFDPAVVIEQEIFKPLNIFFAGYDALGNFRTDTPSNLVWNWTTPSMSLTPPPLSQTQGSLVTVVSELTGEGKL